jgi:ribonuclease PH
LAQAQIEMYDTVVACSALIHESMVIVDPTQTELDILGKDAGSRALVTCALMPNSNRITQVHSIGPLSASLLQETLNMTMDGAKAVYQSSVKLAITTE